MNIAVLPIVCLISLVLAEPPVGDGYPAARSGHHHSDHNNHHGHTPDHEHQRSLPQEYGPPSRNAISTEYGAPNARSSNSRGAHRHTPATVRVSFNQRFRSAARSSTRNSHDSSQGSSEGYAPSNTQSGSEPRSLSQEYGVPSPSRSLSTEYGAPAEKYGTPVTRSQSTTDVRHQNSLSRGRSVPNSQLNSKSGSSESITRFNNFDKDSSYSKLDAQNPSQSYGAPKNYLSAAHETTSLSTSYNAPSTVSNSPSQSYGAPKSAPSSSYGVPSLSVSSRASESHSHDHNSLSHSYTAPSERDLSETYGAPDSRILSQEYRVPSAGSRNLQTDAMASPYPDISSRSSSSLGYQPARGDDPSQQYGAPEQNQGYEKARARALEELLNQEPANYDFAYQIQDQESGTDFGHSETRQENRAEGSYFVVLPDGTRQTVDYEADEGGFRPRISVEPAASGYDDNAQDLSRSHQGPY